METNTLLWILISICWIGIGQITLVIIQSKDDSLSKLTKIFLICCGPLFGLIDLILD